MNLNTEKESIVQKKKREEMSVCGYGREWEERTQQKQGIQSPRDKRRFTRRANQTIQGLAQQARATSGCYC
jgi:hypothetical protein